MLFILMIFGACSGRSGGLYFLFCLSFKWHWWHLNVKLVDLCSSKNAMTMSLRTIGVVVSGQTRAIALFSKTGLSSPIPWHLSVDGCAQSLHACFFIYVRENVARTRFVNIQSEKSLTTDSWVEPEPITVCHLSPFLILWIFSSNFLLWMFATFAIVVDSCLHTLFSE